MKKSILTAFFTVFISLSPQSYSYIPSDVNQFKNNKDCVRCNLTGSSFSSYGTLEKSEGIFDGTFFTKISLSNYVINTSSFINTNFVQSYLSNNEFRNSNFQNANLSYSNLSNVKFIKSVFNQVNFSHIGIAGSFSSCSFNEVNFTKSDLDNVSFSKSSLINANFEDTTLKNADLTRVHIENVSFNNADLSYAILIGSNITEEHLAKAKAYKCATLSNGDVYTNNGQYDCKNN